MIETLTSGENTPGENYLSATRIHNR
jgi:hypothetical protein